MTSALEELREAQLTAFDAGTVFSGQASGRTIDGFATPTAYTPQIDPAFIYPEAVRELVVWLMAPADPLYVFGPTGSGKSSLVRQVAAKLNYPVFEVTGHGRMEFSDLTGHLSLQDGSMSFQDGPLTLAMRFGGLFLLNEIDLLDPAVAIGLNGVLDGQALCLPENGGELVQPHPAFRFVATANTNGGSDETGLYQGTLRQNLAFMDRFWLCEVGYPAAETELGLLEKAAPALPECVRSGMVEFAQQVRRLFMGDPSGVNPAERIEVTLSTRTLLRWADLTQRFQPLARMGIQPITYALDRALGYRAIPSTRALLQELGQRLFAPPTT